MGLTLTVTLRSVLLGNLILRGCALSYYYSINDDSKLLCKDRANEN